MSILETEGRQVIRLAGIHSVDLHVCFTCYTDCQHLHVIFNGCKKKKVIGWVLKFKVCMLPEDSMTDSSPGKFTNTFDHQSRNF